VACSLLFVLVGATARSYKKNAADLRVGGMDGGGGGTADPTLSSGPDYAFTLPE